MVNIISNIIILFIFAELLLIIDIYSLNSSFGLDNDTIYHSNTTALQNIKINVLENSKNDIKDDTIPPFVNIVYPQYPPTITTGKIIIQVSANDSNSGIKNVSAVAHTFPFNGHFPIKLTAIPISVYPNKESHWNIPLTINTTGTYRVVIEIWDNAGNPSFKETTINAPY